MINRSTTEAALSVVLDEVATEEGGGQVVAEGILDTLIRQRLHRSKAIHDVLRLAEVDFVERVPNLVLHVFAQAPNVGYVRVVLRYGVVLVNLQRETNDFSDFRLFLGANHKLRKGWGGSSGG